MMNNTEGLQALKTYFDLMCMNGGSHIFRTANELNIFKVLTSGQLTCQEIAEACKMQDKPLLPFLEVLVSMKIIVKDDNKFCLSPVMQLLQGNYQNLSDEYWQHLKIFLSTGEPLKEMDSTSQSEAHYQGQVKALEWMMKPSAFYAATALGIGSTRKNLNILDVGAGSAIWSLTFATMDPLSKVTAIDWPQVLQVAKHSAETAGLTDRFTSLEGNYHEVELEDESYDTIIIANVCHLETEEGNLKLFTKMAKALKSGGEIIVIDVFNGQEQGDVAASLYTLGLALRTKNSKVYKKDELEYYLEKTGFADISFTPLDIVPNTMAMVIGKKK